MIDIFEGHVYVTPSVYNRIKLKKARRRAPCFRCRKMINIGDIYSGNIRYVSFCKDCAIINYKSLLSQFQDKVIIFINEQLNRCEAASMKQVKVEDEIYI